MKRIIIIALLFLNFSACTQSSNNVKYIDGKQNDSINGENFDNLIKNVTTKIVDLTAPGGLANIEEFMVIYNNINSYENEIRRAIESEEYSELEKMICVYAMQKLNFDKYFMMSEHCLNLFERGQISEAVFRLVIMPSPWKTEIRYPEKHKKQEVQQLMTRILESKKLSKVGKDEIYRILSGQALKNIRDIQIE